MSPYATPQIMCFTEFQSPEFGNNAWLGHFPSFGNPASTTA